jgi:demethoxyubiquinone hydroxylase (CLK1/Coq7/Cat5 family)
MCRDDDLIWSMRLAPRGVRCRPSTAHRSRRERSPPVAAVEMTDQQRGVFADVLSQAITGELIGMANYAAMVRLYPHQDDQRDMLSAAASELGHSERFRRAARELGVTPIVNLEAPYWLRIRTSFLRHVDANDPIA